MRWCLASLRDGDTHLVADVAPAVHVTGLCGTTFRVLTVLPGKPPDPVQACTACAAEAARALRRDRAITT